MQGPAGFCRISLPPGPPGGDAPLRRLTPTAPLAGAPLENRRKKASPARGGVTEGDGGVHCRVAFYGIFPGCAKPAQGPMIFNRPGEGGGCRKARGTMRASSPTNARQGPAGVCGISLPPGGDAPLSRLTPTAPLTGAPLGNRRKKASPARGGGCAAGADGGVRHLAGALRLRDVCAARRQARPLQFLTSHSSLPQNSPSARRRASSVYTGVRRSQWGGIRRR